MVQEIDGLRFVMDYLSGEMIDPSREPSLYEQLSNHTMEISTLKEADLCGSSNMKERIFVTTIHKAKGLEFDNVIMPFCDWALEKTDTIWCTPQVAPFNELPLVCLVACQA